MAEQTQSHRIEMDKGELEFAHEKEKNENSYARWGQFLSFSLMVAFATGAFLSAYIGQPGVGGAFLAAPLFFAISKVVTSFTERKQRKADKASEANETALSKP